MVSIFRTVAGVFTPSCSGICAASGRAEQRIGRDAAQLSGQLKEWEAGFERNQTAWSEEAKSLAQKSLNAALRAARENAARLLEESSRENAALIRKAFDDGFGRMRETLAVAQVIVWLALAAALVAAGITACYILRLH